MCFVIIKYPHKIHCFIMILQLLDIWFLQHYYYKLLEDSYYTSLSLLHHSLETQYLHFFPQMSLYTVPLILFESLIMKSNLNILILPEFLTLFFSRSVGVNNQIYLIDSVEKNSLGLMYPCNSQTCTLSQVLQIVFSSPW